MTQRTLTTLALVLPVVAFAGLLCARAAVESLVERATPAGLARLEQLTGLSWTVGEVDAVLAELTPQQILEPRRIQGFDVNVLQAIFDSVPHLQGHTQEIIHITRSMLGPRYRFYFVPKTPEEGAPQ